MVQALTAEDFAGISLILTQILGNDNEVRKAAEAQLNVARRTQTDKYATLLSAVIHPSQEQISMEAKSLAAVLLRGNISTWLKSAEDAATETTETTDNLWTRISEPVRVTVKQSIIETLQSVNATNKRAMHKVADLAVEVQGAMVAEHEGNIWRDLLDQLFAFIQTDNDAQVDTGLVILNGLFGHILDHMVKYKSELGGIFERTLQFQQLDIKLEALKAVSNYLATAERKDTKEFIKLLPLMTAVVVQAHTDEDETVLEEALIEFNELSEIEPNFFRADFKTIYEAFKPIIANKEFTNNSIRHQPLEFATTMIERKPTLAKKDDALIKDILDQIFQLMIDIDQDIDADWMTPKEGFAGEDEEEDNVNFGKQAIDRLVAGVGEEKMLPLIGFLVQQTIANDNDWRYKHAGIMAFSQVGEYVDEIEKIATMVPVIVENVAHANPKIRYAALHAIGQLADDMPNDFQKTFSGIVMPAMIAALDDTVPRVQAHACACITNFCENATKEMLLPHLQVMSAKFGQLIQNGISITKEGATTALGTFVEKIGEGFIPHFAETIQFLITYLTQFATPEYKQFRGQAIETMTIICTAVGMDTFRPLAADVIGVMLQIQTTGLDKKDSQRIYLLSAWQRICLLMTAEFGPYLRQVLPSVMNQAALLPSMGVEGQDNLADLSQVLSEVTPDQATSDGNTMNVVTDEIEEKDVALQMLSVFIDEVPDVCFEYGDQISKLLLSLTNYSANDSIRQTSAQCLSGLIKAAKSREVLTPQLHSMGKTFSTNLQEAMKQEYDPDTMLEQVQALKEIIDTSGPGLMTQDEVDELSIKAVGIVNKSLQRIAQNNALPAEEVEDEDDALDADDLALIKEENSNEFDLQVGAAELMGILMKTHRDYVAKLVLTLRNEIIPACFASQEQKRLKFALFILDDMIEHLGPAYFPAADFQQMVQAICGFSSHNSAALRQASAYGIGVIAQNAGDHFQACSELCLTSLKSGIEFAVTPKIQGKKEKMTMYHHARDNAIASIGKVIKYQNALVQSNPQYAANLVTYWLGLLPITHDIQEATMQVQFLSEMLAEMPGFIFGADPNSTAQILAKIYGETWQEKYFAEMKDEGKVKIASAVRYLLSSAPAPVPDAFKAACENILAADCRANVEAAFNFSQ